jgi:hypothetical protein
LAKKVERVAWDAHDDDMDRDMHSVSGTRMVVVVKCFRETMPKPALKDTNSNQLEINYRPLTKIIVQGSKVSRK